MSPGLSEDTSSNTRFAGLCIDGMWLLVEQSEILSLEPLLGIDRTDASDGCIGSLSYAGQVWPVICCDAELQRIAAVPESRLVSVLFRDWDHVLLVDELVLLPSNHTDSHDLAVCMRTNGTPVTGLLSCDLGVAAVTSARALAFWFDSMAAVAPELREVAA